MRIKAFLKNQTTLLVIGVMALLLSGALFGGWLYAMRQAARRLVYTHELVRLSRLSSGFDGFRIAVLADIHMEATREDKDRLMRIVAKINSEKPDMVALLGDFIGGRIDFGRHNATAEDIARILRPLRARCGVYAVLGNHDHWHDGTRMADALKNVGIRVLQNESSTLTVNGAKLHLIGLPDRLTRHHTLDTSVFPRDEAPGIVLSHDPAYFAREDLPYELMLAGHTHGGQINLPVMGESAIHIVTGGERFIEGWYEIGGRKLFVTRGIGTSVIQARWRCTPEVVFLTLRSAGK